MKQIHSLTNQIVLFDVWKAPAFECLSILRERILHIQICCENNFLCNDIMRYFDLFRKTLNQQEVKKDLKRFSNLSSLEMEYYFIWGYPYLFEFSNHHISVSDITKEIIFDNSIKSLNYSNISLMRQDSLNGKFISICKSD